MEPRSSFYAREESVFEVLFFLALSVIAVPVIIVLGLTVYLSMGRPVFFLQQRVGQHKKPFTMYKFRTMYQGAHGDQKKYQKLNQAPGPMFKIFDDPRFVGVGRFLSRTGLDELPQFINIWRGEMNLVGPRPLPVEEAAQLDESWDFRYTVKPGIFSEWTASPLRHKNLNLWLELDKLTVQNLYNGWWYKFHLLVKTLWQQLR